MNMDREASMITSEHVRLQLPTAGAGSRAAALLIDVLLLAAAIAVLLLIVALPLTISGLSIVEVEDYVIGFVIVVFFLLIGGYFVGMEYNWGGQTLGKKWMGIRVIQENGQPLSFLGALIRNCMRLIDFLPSFFVLGFLWSFFHSKDKRLGDLAAGTLVVREPQHERHLERKRLRKWQLRHMSQGSQQPLPVEACEQITHEEWVLLSEFVERMPTLEQMRAQQMAGRIAEILGRRLQLEPQRYLAYPLFFLVQLYEQVKGEWQI